MKSNEVEIIHNATCVVHMQNIELTLKSVKELNKIQATFGLIIKMTLVHKRTDIKLCSSTVLSSNALYKCECAE
jgi:hypothetical protein